MNQFFTLVLSALAGGKPDDITVLLSIVAEYTDWKCVTVCMHVCVLLWGWSFLPVCPSLPPAAPWNMHCILRTDRGMPRGVTHTADVCPSTSFVSSYVLFLVLKRSRGGAGGSDTFMLIMMQEELMPFSLVVRHQHLLSAVTQSRGRLLCLAVVRHGDLCV